MIRFTLSLLLAVLFCSNVYAAKYTSAQNGIYTTPSTWMGNVAPPSTLSGADTVIINHNVSFGLDITMSHPLAYIQVASNKIFGRITNQYLSITGGAVINSNGLVQADSLFINDPANKLHFNMLDARAMRVDTFVNNYTVTIFERLYIQGRYSFSSPLSFFLNSVVYMDGGEIVKTGTANFCMPNNRYDLVYRQPTLTGIELENANFKNVTIDLASPDSVVTLMDDLTMNDTLRLLNGCLSLSYPNNYNRTLTFSGNGDLVTTSNGYLWMKRVITNSYPGIKVYTNHGLTSALRFHPDNYYLYLLDINTTKPVKLATTLMVKTGLLLSSMLDIQGNKLIAEYLTSFRFSKSAYINMAPGAQFEHDAWNREIFPVGAGGYYSPVVARQNATGYSPWQSISLVDTIYEHGDTGNIWSSSKPCVRRTWKFDGTHFNRIHPYVRISWPGAMEANGFDRNNAYIAFYDSATSKWTKGSNCQKAVLDTNGLWSVEVTNIPTGHFIILDTNTALTVNGPAISQQSQFKLYPNPATNVLHVEGNTLANADAQIINAMGQKIKTITLQKGNNTISIAELPAGNYWLRLGEESRQFTKR